MSDIETIITCPLGSVCREVKDGKIYQCAWFTQMKGKDAAGDEHDKWGCAISWQPILTTEVSGAIRQNSASIQSMRNIQDQRQQEAIAALEKRNA